MRRRHVWRLAYLFFGLCSCALWAQGPLTWEQVRDRFQKNNPSLLAGELLANEARADEVTAGLRPNPEFSSIDDEFSPNNGGSQLTQSITQLIERRHKRALRVESARYATTIAGSDQQDMLRQLLFSLRDAFVRTLQAKAWVELAGQNLINYDKILEVNRERYRAGDIAGVDMTRLELQRAQFESDAVNAKVNLRTAKIALLALMNERQAVDSFDVSGEFAYRPLNMTLDDARRASLAARPDLKSATTAVTKAQSDHQLGGGGETGGAPQGARGVAEILAQDVGVHRRGIAQHFHKGAHPQRGQSPYRGVAKAAREDGAHFAGILMAEGSGVQTEQQAVEAHHALPGAKPLARAMPTRSVRRRASARATAVPNGVMR